jgi:hypothetical protein
MFSKLATLCFLYILFMIRLSLVYFSRYNDLYSDTGRAARHQYFERKKATIYKSVVKRILHESGVLFSLSVRIYGDRYLYPFGKSSYSTNFAEISRATFVDLLPQPLSSAPFMAASVRMDFLPTIKSFLRLAETSRNCFKIRSHSRRLTFCNVAMKYSSEASPQTDEASGIGM